MHIDDDDDGDDNDDDGNPSSLMDTHSKTFCGSEFPKTATRSGFDLPEGGGGEEEEQEKDDGKEEEREKEEEQNGKEEEESIVSKFPGDLISLKLRKPTSFVTHQRIIPSSLNVKRSIV